MRAYCFRSPFSLQTSAFVGCCVYASFAGALLLTCSHPRSYYCIVDTNHPTARPFVPSHIFLRCSGHLRSGHLRCSGCSIHFYMSRRPSGRSRDTSGLNPGPEKTLYYWAEYKKRRFSSPGARVWVIIKDANRTGTQVIVTKLGESALASQDTSKHLDLSQQGCCRLRLAVSIIKVVVFLKESNATNGIFIHLVCNPTNRMEYTGRKRIMVSWAEQPVPKGVGPSRLGWVSQIGHTWCQMLPMRSPTAESIPH